jgi:hypothetical protein
MFFLRDIAFSTIAKNLLLFLFVIVVASPLAAQTTTPKRVALLVGNSNYDNQPLKNPVNDVAAVAKALEALSFDVTVKKDRTKIQLESDIDELTKDRSNGDLCLFFYAGHGVQVDNQNFMVPIGAKAEREHHVKHRCVNLNYLIDAMEDSDGSLNVVILDACRNNPFRSFSRSSTKGFSAIPQAPTGMIVSFSAPSGQVTPDGDGDNSPFTLSLVKTLNKKPPAGLQIVDVFLDTSQMVRRQTGLTPYLRLDASMPDYYLVRPKVTSDSVSNKEALSALLEKIADNNADWKAEYKNAESDEAKAKIKEAAQRDGAIDVDEVLKISEALGSDQMALEALVFIAKEGLTDEEHSLEICKQATDHHLRSRNIGDLLKSFSLHASIAYENLLKTLARQSISKSARAQATWNLIRLMDEAVKLAPNEEELKLLSEDPEAKTICEFFSQIDTSEQRYMKLLDRLENRYPDETLVHAEKKKCSEAVQYRRYRLEHLSVGKVAPEIEGEGLDGVKFKLSDYRGNVVLIDFWADW